MYTVCIGSMYSSTARSLLLMIELGPDVVSSFDCRSAPPITEKIFVETVRENAAKMYSSDGVSVRLALNVVIASG